MFDPIHLLAGTEWLPHVTAIVYVKREMFTRSAADGLLRRSAEIAFTSTTRRSPLHAPHKQCGPTGGSRKPRTPRATSASARTVAHSYEPFVQDGHDIIERVALEQVAVLGWKRDDIEHRAQLRPQAATPRIERARHEYHSTGQTERRTPSCERERAMMGDPSSACRLRSEQRCRREARLSEAQPFCELLASTP